MRNRRLIVAFIASALLTSVVGLLSNLAATYLAPSLANWPWLVYAVLVLVFCLSLAVSVYLFGHGEAREKDRGKLTVLAFEHQPALLEGHRPRYCNLPQSDCLYFVGREQELERIHTWLSPTSNCRVVTINGPGGIGKTALALNTARFYLDEYARLDSQSRFEAIIWASAQPAVYTSRGIISTLDPKRSLEDVYACIADCLGSQDLLRVDPKKQVDVVKQALGRQRTLLVLDSLEGTNDVRVFSFLCDPDLPVGTKVIVTSREALLDWETCVSLEELTSHQVAELARRDVRASALLPDDLIQALYRRIGGNPLAVRLCFSLIASGENPETLLLALKEDADPRQAASFCFDYSRRRLEQESSVAHTILDALALFVPWRGATAAMVAAIIGGGATSQTVSAEFGRISRLGLARQVSGGYYQIPPLLQQYVLRDLNSELLDKWRLRQARYFQESVLRSYIVHVDFVCGSSGTSEHAREIENLELVFAWGQTQSDFLTMYLPFADGLSALLYLAGNVNRAIEIAKEGEAKAHALASREKEYDFANKLALYYTWSDRFSCAESALCHAEVLSAKMPDYRPDNVLEYRGSYLMRKDDGAHLYDAYQPLQQSTDLREQFAHHDRDQRVAVLGRFMMGVWYYRVGMRFKTKNTEAGFDQLDGELLQKLRLVDPLTRGEDCWSKLLFERANAWLEKGLELASDEQVNFERGRAYILNYLGNVHIEQEQYSKAENELECSLAMAQSINDRRRIARVQQTFSHLRRAQGWSDEAQRLAFVAMRSFELLGMMAEMKEIQHELRSLAK